MFRRIQTPLLAAVMALGIAGTPVHAGTDTLVHFANLSPFTAKVDFPTNLQDCWHDTGAEDDNRVGEYTDYYRRGVVSEPGYRDYLDQFKQHVGVKDFATLPGQTMAGTNAVMAPSANGKPAAMAVFRGETSAQLLAGCKLSTSTRGFRVTLSDSAGTEVSQQYYALQDPPDTQWKISRLDGPHLDRHVQTLTLGSGGTAHALDIGLLVADAVGVGLTVVSLGTAAAEYAVARALITEAARDLARFGLSYSVRNRLFTYVLVGGLRTLETGTTTVVRAGLTRGIAARIFYTALVDGSVWYVNAQQGDKNAPGRLDLSAGGTADVDYASVGLDLSQPDLKMMNGLPDDLSICVYETTTVTIRECRLVGLSFHIMPDGSLVFVPMPGVGSGS